MNAYLLHHLLMNTALKYPEKKAIILDETSVTYGDLERWSNQLALVLCRLGVRVGDRVAIMLNKSIESIVSLFGVLKAGGAYVPIDPRTPATRADYIIRNCGIECLITSFQNITKILPGPNADVPLRNVIVTEWNEKQSSEPHKNVDFVPWQEMSDETPESYRSINMADVNPAYILYTSGSTGVPKGVVISHLNSLTFVNMAAEFFGIKGEDRLGSFAPLHFDLSVFDIFVAVKCGATIVLVPGHLATFPMKLAEYIDGKGISVWNSVSSVLTMLADRGKLDKFGFDSLRIVHFSGDVLPVKYLRFLKTRMSRAQFFNIYGQTEANSSMYYPVKENPPHDSWKIPIGQSFPNFEVFALDENNRIIETTGIEGELYVRGSTVALGYWGDRERTEKGFIEDPLRPYSPYKVYKTGDVVRRDSDGNYVFVGRKDHMIKSRGYRIDLNEIELALNSHPSVKQAAVVAIPDELIGKKIIAFVSASATAGEILETKDLLEFCGKLLPKYMVPEAIQFCESLPMTSSGKVDRKSLEGDALLKYSESKSVSSSIGAHEMAK